MPECVRSGNCAGGSPTSGDESTYMPLADNTGPPRCHCGKSRTAAAINRQSPRSRRDCGSVSVSVGRATMAAMSKTLARSARSSKSRAPVSTTKQTGDSAARVLPGAFCRTRAWDRSNEA